MTACLAFACSLLMTCTQCTIPLVLLSKFEIEAMIQSAGVIEVLQDVFARKKVKSKHASLLRYLDVCQ